MFFRMRNIQVFQLIERKGLHGEILQHLEALMEIDRKVCSGEIFIGKTFVFLSRQHWIC